MSDGVVVKRLPCFCYSKELQITPLEFIGVFFPKHIISRFPVVW